MSVHILRINSFLKSDAVLVRGFGVFHIDYVTYIYVRTILAKTIKKIYMGQIRYIIGHGLP